MGRKNLLKSAVAPLALSVLWAAQAHAAIVSNPVITGVSTANGACAIDLDVQVTFEQPNQFFGGPNDDAFAQVYDQNGTHVSFLDPVIRAVPGDVNSPRSITVRAVPAATSSALFVRFSDVIAPQTLQTQSDFAIPPSVVDNVGGACALASANTAPIANAGGDQTGVVSGATVVLDGSGSSDPDNDALTYSWTQTGGPAVALDDPTSATPSFVVPTGLGTTQLTFELVVNDGTVDSSPDSVSIEIVNQAPSVNAGSDLAEIVPGSQVTLNGTGSSDPDGDTLSYTWTQISGESVTLDDPNSATPRFIAPGGTAGQPLVFELVVNDGFVASQADQVQVSVQDNVAVTRAQIGEFIAARSAILLANQPELQRRIDRLQGRSRADQNGAQVAGAFVPGSQNLPIKAIVNGQQMMFSSSLSQARGGPTNGVGGSWDIWSEVTLTSVNVAALDGDMLIAYLGFDYALSDDVLIGLLGQYDHYEAETDDASAVREGKGWMVGPYLTARLSQNIFFDGRLAYGTSANEIAPFATYVDTFDTKRWLLSGALVGEWEAAAGLTIRPELEASWIDEQAKTYTDRLNTVITGQSVNIGQVSAAPRIVYTHVTKTNVTLSPFVEARGIVNFGDEIRGLPGNSTRMRIEGGLDVLDSSGLRLTASAFQDGIGMVGYSSAGVQLGVSYSF